MFRVLITDVLAAPGVALLEAANDISFDILTELTESDLTRIIPKYDALIIRSSVTVTKTILENAGKLRVIGRAGVGIDNIDVEQASLQNIKVLSTPGANSIATAEHTMALMMAICHKIPQAHNLVRSGQWNRKALISTQLYGKTIGLVGLGRVGREVALRCSAFGMRVLACDPFIDSETALKLPVSLVNLDGLFRQADIISLHATLTPETTEMINTKTIASMKSGVFLINCARGALVNEADLAEALKSRKIAGAALDVYTVEPLPIDSPLRGLDNIILSPHMAASTIEAQQEVSCQIVRRVLNALRNGSQVLAGDKKADLRAVLEPNV